MSYQQEISFTSPATASTVIHTEMFTGLDAHNRYTIIAQTLGATGGDLNVYLQGYNGFDWFDFISFPTLTAGDPALNLMGKIRRDSVPPFPFFNWAVIGINDVPAMWAGDVEHGDFTDRLRIIMVAGAGTAAGAVQTIAIHSFEDLVGQHFGVLGAR